MNVKLPIIDLEGITTLEKARNAIELLLRSQTLLWKENQTLREEINRLKGQPQKPVFTSGKPAANISVTPFLKETTSWHKQAKKKTLPIDREENLSETDQCNCGSTRFITVRTFDKLVQGIIFRRDNVLYSGRVKQCCSCGKKYRSLLPEGIKNRSFSSELSSLLSYLVYACRFTHPLILSMFHGMGISVSSGQISNLLLQNGDKLKTTDDHLRKTGIGNSPYLQSDASSAKRKVNGIIKNQYVQVISNKLLSIFSITPKYNIQTLNQLLTPKGRDKLYVSDDGSSNGNRLSSQRQLCWVHEIRHYKKLFPFFNAHQLLQQKILKQWQEFYHLAKHYGEDPPEQQLIKRKQIEALFDQITSQPTGYDRLDKQLKLTKQKKTRLLLFLDYPQLPIHNNQCEQDLRCFVIKRKISGGTKSERGDRSLERHLSVIQTAQKQGLDVLNILSGLLSGTLSPAILTANIH